MNTIIVGTIFTLISIGAVFLIVKLSRDKTSEELRQIGTDIHKGIGKIELLQEDIRRLDGSYNLNPPKNGSKGDRGLRGEKGDTGETGKTGPRGPKGNK